MPSLMEALDVLEQQMPDLKKLAAKMEGKPEEPAADDQAAQDQQFDSEMMNPPDESGAPASDSAPFSFQGGKKGK